MQHNTSISVCMQTYFSQILLYQSCLKTGNIRLQTVGEKNYIERQNRSNIITEWNDQLDQDKRKLRKQPIKIPGIPTPNKRARHVKRKGNQPLFYFTTSNQIFREAPAFLVSPFLSFHSPPSAFLLPTSNFVFD